MDFTERDARLLRWLNGHGFVIVRQAADWLGVSYQTAHRRLKLLADGGYAIGHRFGHSRFVYRVTAKGTAMAGDELPPLDHVALGTYRHNLQLVDLARQLIERFHADFVPERRLRQERNLTGVGATGHLPDGLLHIGSDKPIAIELELSTKGRRRLDRIIRGYVRDLSLGEVWYFTGSTMVRRGVERAARGQDFIKIHNWPLDPHNGADAILPVSRPHPSIVSGARIVAS